MDQITTETIEAEIERTKASIAEDARLRAALYRPTETLGVVSSQERI